ncbi:hypothetical protein AXK56_19985 [Tsukamurella pulmonis]|uniref:Uncharacterized protein n=1 Tax=Tsukamurella pulmonis TaxID=47312 RepID=A0A1H1HB47_9ACTN|nr:hypothetical protein [Tsukamurella pulmonis]KXO94880.1 hypothetical protein AXK56_19985 [Tsukamurella pulmonis]SDR22674.1 hypothetical protein SAMN04489765_3995 [Tsukamurella pulmonis]SUP15341.1 Uncharacterised protein [Tsukamurella pulmonis]
MGKFVSGAVSVSIALFAIGLIAIAALFLTPLVTGGTTAPTWVYALTPLAPVGFLVGVIAVIIGGRVGDREQS